MKIGNIGVRNNIKMRLTILLHKRVFSLILMQCSGLMFVFLYRLVGVLRISRQDG